MPRYRYLSLFLGLLFLVAPSAGQQLSHTRIVRGATLIDGTGRAPQPNVSILIEGGKIKAIAQEIAAPPGAEVIDGTGKFIVPGLMDARVQLGSTPGNRILRAEVGLEQRIASLNALLGAGVTSARLIQGDLADGHFYQRWEQDNLLASPRLTLSGPTFTAPQGHPVEQYSILAQGLLAREIREVADSDQARDKARSVAHARADSFEVVYDSGAEANRFPRLSEDALAILVREAHGHDLKVFCWVGHNEEALTAIAAGVDVVEGLSEEVLSDEVLAQMSKKNVSYLPSLVSQAGVLDLLEKSDVRAYLAQPIVHQSLSPLLQESMRSEAGMGARLHKIVQNDSTVHTLLVKEREHAFENVRRAQLAGVHVIVGTGAGGTLIFAGASVHWELELLVRSGLSPMDALLAATRNLAASLGKDEELGTIEAGKQADLVVLNANPLDDIANTQKIDLVIKAGWVFHPGDVDSY